MTKFKESILRIIKIPIGIFNITRHHHTGAYAAQAAYFFFLSLIPILLTLITLIRFTPIDQQDVIEAMTYIFPSTVLGFITGIIDQVFTVSATVIPISILVTLWSAGRGVLAITHGLNIIYENVETRNYLFVRMRSTVYTICFIVGIILTLLGSVFGNVIRDSLTTVSPFMKDVIDVLIRAQVIFTILVMTIFWMFVFRYLPNRGHKYKITLFRMFPGAVFVSVSWLLISAIFSMYLRIFTNFQSMYGSLTTVVLLMLWLYFCMYIVLLGGELNAFIERYRESQDLYRARLRSGRELIEEDELVTQLMEEELESKNKTRFLHRILHAFSLHDPDVDEEDDDV